MKKITKLLLLLVICTSAFVLTGCAEKNIEGELPDIIEKIYEKMYAEVAEKNRPALFTVDTLNEFPDLTEEEKLANVEFVIGTKDIEYKEIYESKPTISAIAYSVVLIRMEENADIEAAKTAIKESVNPRKWGCVAVEEEDIIVKSKGDLIILIMVEDDTLREKIEEGFDAL